MEVQQQWGEWYPLLNPLLSEPWMQKIGRLIFKVRDDLAPSLHHVFRAFSLCPPSKLKVVIIGQDPYINGEADGLAFSSYGKMTPSLEVVFDEINRSQIAPRSQTHLDDWAEQGVLLLNSVLTTVIGQSKAHAGWGWELFVDATLEIISNLHQPIAIMAWGRDAQMATKKCNRVGNGPGNGARLYCKASHPQAQNYNPTNKFIGCNHFLECNLFLMKHGLSPIWWSDPKYLNHGTYTQLIETLQKHMTYAKVDYPEVVYSYPAISNKPHPFSDGLEPEYSDNLPF